MQSKSGSGHCNYDLIDYVRARPQLWDRNAASDVTTRDELWREVSVHMNWEKEVCKMRWKNLRDAYKKTLKRPFSEAPTWPYYEHMIFLKDILVNAPPKTIDITQSDSKSQDLDFSPIDKEEDTMDSVDPLSITNSKHRVSEEADMQFCDVDMDRSLGTHGSHTYRNSAKRSRPSTEDDDDYQFLLSILPHMRQVPVNRKLPLRIRIEQVIYEECYRDK